MLVLQDKAFITHCLLFTTILTNNLENTKNHQQLRAFPSFLTVFCMVALLDGLINQRQFFLLSVFCLQFEMSAILLSQGR